MSGNLFEDELQKRAELYAMSKSGIEALRAAHDAEVAQAAVSALEDLRGRVDRNGAARSLSVLKLDEAIAKARVAAE